MSEALLERRLIWPPQSTAHLTAAFSAHFEISMFPNAGKGHQSANSCRLSDRLECGCRSPTQDRRAAILGYAGRTLPNEMPYSSTGCQRNAVVGHRDRVGHSEAITKRHRHFAVGEIDQIDL